MLLPIGFRFEGYHARLGHEKSVTMTPRGPVAIIPFEPRGVHADSS